MEFVSWCTPNILAYSSIVGRVHRNKPKYLVFHIPFRGEALYEQPIHIDFHQKANVPKIITLNNFDFMRCYVFDPIPYARVYSTLKGPDEDVFAVDVRGWMPSSQCRLL